jgi:hypothetical protein
VSWGGRVAEHALCLVEGAEAGRLRVILFAKLPVILDLFALPHSRR